MLLPANRNTTYGAASPVKSQDLDDIQDCIVDGKFANRWQWSALCRGSTETNITYDGGDFAHANANAALWTARVGGVIKVGDRITNIGVNIKGTGGAQNVQLVLNRCNGDGTSTSIETLVIANPAAAWAKFTKALVTPEVAVDGKSYYWVINLPLLNTYFADQGFASDRL